MALSASTKSKTYNKKTLSKMAARDKSGGSNVQNLANKLEGLTKTAKGLGIDTARSDALVAQTRAEGSKAFKGSSYDRGQVDTVVTKATDIGKMFPAALPMAPEPTKTPAFTLDGVAGYTTGAQGYTAIPVDSSTDTLDASNARSAQNGLQYLRDMMGLAPQADQGVNDYARMEKEMGIKKLEKQVSQYTGSLNSILATRDQNLEQLRGTGSQYGVTEAVYGGQANEINREAYIKAAPVQAALDTAQGNLQMAEARLDKLFAIHQQDVKNTHDYNVNMVQSLYQFMDKQETNRANQLIAREQQKYQEKTNNINYLRQLSAMAIQTGQQGLITQLGNIDPNSPTFEQDVARLQSQIRIPVKAETVAQPDYKNFGTAENPNWGYIDANGKFNPVSGLNNITSEAKAGQLIATSKYIDTADAILSSNAIDSVVGTSILSRGAGNLTGVIGRFATGAALGAAGGSFIPGVGTIIGALSGGTLAAAQGGVDSLTGERQDLIANISSLIANTSMDKLVQSKQQGATYGALSEGEWKKIDEASTKLGSYAIKNGDGKIIGFNSSEDSVLNEVDTLRYYSVLDYALKGGDPTEKGAIVAEDGTYGYVTYDGKVIPLKPE